jgi:hypothetical protein
MVDRVRTVDFLPEIFQTPTNKQVLSATLDQLVQEPKFKKTQGYVGRRIGPGVNADDRYVVEPTTERTDYQLEPGVVMLDPDSAKIRDTITYPGISNALALNGANVADHNRLYTSDYYSWDPFVDFDKLVNFSQYYWLPAGPDAVDVYAGQVPSTNNFVITRANGVYTVESLIGNYPGDNPVIPLLRGGNYTFQVAQNAKETVNFRVGNTGTSAYLIDYEPNPTLTLARGNTYVFSLTTTGVFPFWIKTQPTQGVEDAYNSGVSGNGSAIGNITFVVPQDAPDSLFYACQDQFNMQGRINIVDGTPGTGPGFWIQSAPGVNGTLPWAPNISSRDVLGVSNNGEDLGTVRFDIPYNTAQNFYYGLNYIGNSPTPVPVDFVTNLKFSDINNQFLAPFLAQYGGIDGVTSFDGRTIVFLDSSDSGGWEITTQFDPLAATAEPGLTGTYDTTLFSQVTPITTQSLRTSVWQISYATTAGGDVYLKLNSVLPIDQLQKFSVSYGTEYSKTEWYRNSSGVIERIPLLTAIQNILYYQDGTDPGIAGQLRLVDPTGSTTLYIEEILNQPQYISPNGVKFTNGLKVQFRGDVIPASYQNQQYYVEGVGTAIRLLPVTDFVTPEKYTKDVSLPYDTVGFDNGNFDASLNQPLVSDYLTINRASQDLNAWSRCNRWFHTDVITASADYNGIVPSLDNLQRARRPILEFRAGMRLFRMGTQAKQPVDIIDFSATDALSNVNGSTGYGVDGYEFQPGTRVIFAADNDPQVRNKIYQVNFISPDTESPVIVQPVINLVPAADADVLIDQNVVCLRGLTLQGSSFYFDGLEWVPAQQKSSVNQAPLFDVYDSTGTSLANREKYFSSTFAGSKLFSYASGQGVADSVLGFSLRYLSLSNIGDIVFDNNLYCDTFVYVDNGVGVTEKVSTGFVRQYSSRLEYSSLIGWQPAVTKSLVRQQFQFRYDGTPLKLDVQVLQNSLVPAVQLYVGTEFQSADRYTVTTTADSTTIVLNQVYAPGSIIDVAVLSNQVSKQGFYQVPINLENNPFNSNSQVFTLGTARSHYETIGENLIGLSGPINGANNSRDLGNIVPYGLQILQQSSPVTLAGFFMRDPGYDIFKSLSFNDREYTKFKSRMLQAVVSGEWINDSPSDILDAVITELSTGKTDSNSFYWSDMLPAGVRSIQNKYTVTAITTATFDTVQTYDFESANYQALLVSVNDRLLALGTEYHVAQDGPRVTVLVPLSPGDVVSIREFANTAGNYVPNTPTKLGLYPAWLPRIFVDTNYVNPTPVIQGHDGSITVAFGDVRDQVLLEFELRIYNNLKTQNNPVPLTIAEVLPGYFRTTDYTPAEITSILSESFLTWVGWNKLDYKSQDYVVNNAFTYNYSAAGDRLKNQPLLGAWRGIYRYFYDTLSPNLTPWEMLGFSQKPAWWEDRYGPAPYTADNLVLWDDLSQGVVADPAGFYVKPEYVRPNLNYYIPVGSEGQLLAPLDSVVGQYDPNVWRKSWVVGDGGPVEAAWWTSSSYPFAVMRLLALTRPAEFFSLFADRDLYRYHSDLDQYLYNERYRLDASGVQIYGNGVSKASYINWIVDYNQQLGINSTTALQAQLASLDVRLCYRMASFSDKQYMKVYTERSSPDSQNSSLLLPDESYNLSLYKNVPFAYVNYSAVIVQRTDTGYAVLGYSTTDPYFNIFASRSTGQLQTVSSGGSTVRVPKQYYTNIVQVPYGFNFANQTVVVDFLLSYGQYLTSQGLVFDTRENGFTLDWQQMAREFLYWANQGWATGSVINLNPAATKIEATRAGAVIDSIQYQTSDNLIIDQNRLPVDARNLVIERQGNFFSATSTTSSSIAYIQLRFTNYEHMVVLDNVSIFNDLIYNPVTAARQSRIKISASTTTDWNGTLDAQGFVLNQDNVKEWMPNRRYARGEIVLYKNNYWSAQAIVQPKLEFDPSDWFKSDYARIQRGLLPNLANKADQLVNSYNTQSANLERDNDLLSYGLIGFRPRQYMTALNLDDVSQVNLYQEFIRDKGTVRAAEIFTGADLGKETAEYNIYENWAVKRGTYGANANRSFVELRLDAAQMQSDPATVQVIEPGQSSLANQTVLLNDIWRQSYKITNTDILPVTYTQTTDTALPSAGYVNINDVDITMFSLDDPTNLSQNIDNIGIGTKVWVAQVNSYDWDIYRANKVPGFMSMISDNLDGTSQVTFTQAHGLKRGDLLVIKYFTSAVNGVYRVLNTTASAPNMLTIAYNFGRSKQQYIDGQGIGFFLQTMRVKQASDIVNLPYASELTSGARAWVDNDGNGHWQVLEKQQPFSTTADILTGIVDQNTNFGSSVAQAYNNAGALIGAPGYNNSRGAVYGYGGNRDTLYSQTVLLELTAAETLNYGYSLDFGNQTWAVAGAPGSKSGMGYAAVIKFSQTSDSYTHTQLLIPPDSDVEVTGFGTAVAISSDERWLYVSAPGANRVYAYGRVDVEDQSVTYTTTGVGSYNYANSIMIDRPDQIIVAINNVVCKQGDYTVNTSKGAVVFTIPPQAQQLLVITRRTTQTFKGDGSTKEFSLAPYLYTANTIESFLLSVNDVLQRPGIDYKFYSDQRSVEFIISAPAAGASITATAGTYFQYIDSISFSELPLGARFGQAITTTTDGCQVIIGAPNKTAVYVATTENINLSGTKIDEEPLIIDDKVIVAGYRVLVRNQNNAAENGIYIASDSTWIRDNNANSWHKLLGAYTFVEEGKIHSKSTWECIVPESGILNTDPVTWQKVDTTVGSNSFGSCYVFDRVVTNYLITDIKQTTYTIPGDWNNPVAVKLNNRYLTNSSSYINGDFSIVGNDIVLSTTILKSVQVGDQLEISNNQFKITQYFSIYKHFDNASYGASVDICPYNCSVYVGAPDDGSVLVQAGSVERRINQSRVYGVTESQVANPVLTAGDTVRINNYPVAVPLAPKNNISGMIDAINNSGIPNVMAIASKDLEFVADGITKTFDVGNIYSSAASYTPVVYVGQSLQVNNGIYATYSYNSDTQQIVFFTAPPANQTVKVISGRMTIMVKNSAAATALNKLTVLPGVTGSAFQDLGFETFVYTQTITSPLPLVYAHFGSAVTVNTTALTLVVGAPGGNVYEPMTFDSGDTYFDEHSTTYFSPIVGSGVVYTYDYLPSAADSAADPGKFVFGQQIYTPDLSSRDNFGTALSYVTGRLLVGTPGNDPADASVNYGTTSVFDNLSGAPSWTVVHQQQPVVDVALLNSVFMYNRQASTVTSYLDFFNPLQGKILGVAQQNIDYTGAVDPARYNQGTVHNIGNSWSQDHVGEIWWDTNNVRFIDPNQDDIVYASRRWGQLFPGSRVDIYQWIESTQPPVNYTGPGTPFSLTSYTTRAELSATGVIGTFYYYWVRNISTVNTVAGKRLSTTAIADYIANPRGSGIAYLAPLDASTVAIYNVLDLISANETILHIEYDRQANDDNVHVEYELIAQDRANSFLSDNLYLKLQDSFCGVNSSGAPVPDTTLSPAERYGVEFRPRQSMFVDRFAALKNYLGRANSVLKNYPITEIRKFDLLNSSEPEPPAVVLVSASDFTIGQTYTINTVGSTNFTLIGASSNTVGVVFVATGAGSGSGTASFTIWNQRVADLTELSYQNLALVPAGYRYLVVTDADNNGLWTIYQVTTVRNQPQLVLTRVQNYDTSLYWSYINWYLPGYNSTVNPVAEVANYAALSTLTVPTGASVRVTANSQGKFEIYQRTLTGWDRVGLEDGTIEFSTTLWDYQLGRYGFDSEVFDSQYFDQEPVIETRKIIQAINQELFIDDLAIERNRALMLVFDFVLSEFSAPEWLIKTSLIDVDHRIRTLEPYQIYRQDNQTFVLDYIQEVKPYHVQVREFNLTYDGQDTYAGNVSDFDVPAYYNTNLTIPQYVSPVLTPYTVSTATGTGTPSDVSDTSASSTLWTLTPWTEWYNNHLLAIQSVQILNGGFGYTEPPVVTVTGTCTTPAEMTSMIDSAGRVVGITIVSPGAGYSTTAVVSLSGGNGRGARAVAVMGNNLVRSFRTTIKYDRYQYQSTILEWQPNTAYSDGAQVRYADRVWAAVGTVESESFDPLNWTLVDPATLSGVDRTMGLYAPTANQSGLSLPLLIDGVEYPGVQVQGVNFAIRPGFDATGFDALPFTNLSYDPLGLPTYYQGILDAAYQSSYLDIYLGTRYTDINVEGGAYVDTYSSHAPEELIPGSEFDTLDMRVYTAPGADWTGDGHGFRTSVINFTAESESTNLSFADVLPYPVQVLVCNQTTGLMLALDHNYTVDWSTQQITVTSGTTAGDIVAVQVYEIGGGNQLFNGNFDNVEDSVLIPVDYSLIDSLIIFVNGTVYTEVSYETSLPGVTRVNFDTTLPLTNFVSIAALGTTTVGNSSVMYSWSAPQTQQFVSAGQLSYQLSNSLQYSNPDNAIITVNGQRARSSAGISHPADGGITYLLPVRIGVDPGTIPDVDVRVYVDEIPQVLNADYIVSDWPGANPREIIFVTAPAVGSSVKIYVTTGAQAYISGGYLQFNPVNGLFPVTGDIITVTTWNDTRQQDILTQVIVGPVTVSDIDQQGYDTTDFDTGIVASEPGSFDYSEGTVVQQNQLMLSHTVRNVDRLWISLNGKKLYPTQDFVVNGNEVVLTSGQILRYNDTVVISEFTNQISPEAVAFRIFQDMRGVQETYRITAATTTELTQPLLATDTVIHVKNAAALTDPDLSDSGNSWGVLTINGECIMYRERDTHTNTISSLLRGTRGTGAADHATGSWVYDMSAGNRLPAQYQDRVLSNLTYPPILGDGVTKTFVAETINLSQPDSTSLAAAVEVYLGGTQLTTGYEVISEDPVTVTFDTAPPNGVEVAILVRQGVTWYAQGSGTASNGIALQENTAPAARFLCGN